MSCMQIMIFNADIDLRNIAQIPYEVKITPLECCLEIESHDLDCEVYKN